MNLISAMNTAVRLTFSKLISIVLIFAIGFLSACADPHFLDKTKKDASILNGTEVSANEDLASSVVLITQDLDYKDGKPIFFGLCTGVIIGPRTVITAAHCLDSGISKMKLILNPNPRIDLQKNNIYSVVDFKIHHSYQYQKSASTSVIDLALIYVDHPFQTGFKKFTEIASPDLTTTKNYFNFKIAGFGKTSARNNTTLIHFDELNAHLKTADLQIKPHKANQDFFSIKQWDTSGVCKGDSGGPGFITTEDGEEKLLALAIGVFKFQNEEAEIKDPDHKYSDCAGYGLYLNLSHQMNWIKASTLELIEKNK